MASIASTPGRPRPRRRAWALLGAGLLCLGLGAVRAGCDGPVEGYHAPMAVWAQDGAGVVWLDRKGPRQEHVMFAWTGSDAKIKGRPQRVARRALGSDTPRLGFDGTNFRLVYTHHGDREPGVYAQTLGPTGGFSAPRRIRTEPTHLCRSVATAGGRTVLGWRGAGRLELVELPRGDGPVRVFATAAAPGPITSCDIVGGPAGWGAAWSMAHGPVQVASYAPDGSQLGRAVLAVKGDVGAAWRRDDGGFEVWVRPAEAAGAVRFVLDDELAVRSRTDHAHDAGHLVALAAAPFARPVVGFAQTKRAGGHDVTAYLGWANDRGGLDEVQRLSGHGLARAEGAAWGDGRRAALTFSDSRNGGRVGWWLVQRTKEGAGVREATGGILATPGP